MQWTMASIIAFGAGSIYDISTRAFSTLSFGLGNFGRNSISGQSLVWGLLISLFVILPNSYVPQEGPKSDELSLAFPSELLDGFW